MGNTLKIRDFTFKSKKFIIEFGGMLLLLLFVASNQTPVQETPNLSSLPRIVETEPVEYKIESRQVTKEEQEEIRDEIYYGEIELLALVVYAEAGNQDELGKRYVADCVLNRVDSERFPDSIEEVVYQKNPVQFACTVDGALDRAGYNITDDCFRIAEEEYAERTDSTIIYFRTQQYSSSGHPAFKHGDHYFSTK